MPAGSDSAYFRRTGVFWMVLITASMSFFAWTVFWPEHVPYQQLGPLGSFVKYLVRSHYPWLYYGFWVAWAVHLLEGLYTLSLCSTKGITNGWARAQWLIQTVLFGMASLSLLLAYKPGQQKKHK
ncbi:transmembrane protein 254 [Lissotriton helveticus]